jgi:transcription initiation factor TFIIB
MKQLQNDEILRKKNSNECRECGSLNLLENATVGNVYCQDCGLEHHSCIIDYRTEWRTFSDKTRDRDRLARTGYPTNVLDNGGGLITSLSKADAQLGQVTYSNEKLNKRLKEIEKLCDKLNLTLQRVRDHACEVFKRMTSIGLQKSMRLQVVQAASVLQAARCEGGDSNRTFKEMVLATALSQKEIFRCFKKVKEELKNSPGLSSEKVEHTIVSFSKNYARYLNLPQKWVDVITKVANKTRPDTEKNDDEVTITTMDKTWDGRSHSSIAATVVYIVTRLPRCPQKVSISTVSHCTGVRGSTIISCYRDMLPVIDKLLNVVPVEIATNEEISATF